MMPKQMLRQMISHFQQCHCKHIMLPAVNIKDMPLLRFAPPESNISKVTILTMIPLAVLCIFVGFLKTMTRIDDEILLRHGITAVVAMHR